MTTSNEGVVTFGPSDFNLETGTTYFLVEEHAPVGYQLMNGAVKIVIRENTSTAGGDTPTQEESPFYAEITFPGQSSVNQYSGRATGDGDPQVATIALTISDQPMPSLPQTGGNGRITTAVAGAALVALAGYAFWNKRVRTSHH
ncbi:SpaA isopeptide-forming pilin-related protein [Enorma massiliensis]|uniref:SpaA isopeptide-forming pilin-related protein n=1 Tax=Enorma massiliensis TaxID=1472761 RepID=UPI0034A3A741